MASLKKLTIIIRETANVPIAVVNRSPSPTTCIPSVLYLIATQVSTVSTLQLYLIEKTGVYPDVVLIRDTNTREFEHQVKSQTLKGHFSVRKS